MLDRTLRAACGLALACAMAACGRAEIRPPGAAPAVPLPPRDQAASAVLLAMNGVDTLRRSANAEEFGSALQLDADGTTFEYAQYRFGAGAVPDLLTVDVEAGESSEYWVGVCNYATLRWSFAGPFAAAQNIPLQPTSRSPLGNVPVAVLCTPGERVRIATVKLRLTNGPPAAALQASGAGPAPAQVAFDAAASSDADGTIVQYEWDWENDGSYDETTALPAAEHTYAAAGTYTCLLRVTDDGGAAATASVDVAVTAPGNLPPSAALQASAGGAAPVMIDFDATASSDPDGSIVEYAWDWDADGTYDATTAAAESQHLYTAPGDYVCRVRATDDGGLTATATVDIGVTPALNIPPVAALSGPPDDAPPFTAVFDAAASYDPDGTLAGFSWDLDNDGVFSQTAEELAAEGQDSASIEIPDEASHLVTVKVTDDAGAASTASASAAGSYWRTLTLASDDNVGGYCSLAEVAGHPVIAAQAVDADNLGSLRYLVASTPTGGDPADWTALTLHANPVGSGGVSVTCAVAEVDGAPAVAFSSDNGIYYARSLTASGADLSDWDTVVVDARQGLLSSLAVIDGNPAICYTSGFYLWYSRSSSAIGIPAGDWSAPVQPFSGYGITSASLAEIAGRPAIMYCDGFNAKLFYTHSSTADGTAAADWQATRFELASSGALWPSLVALSSGRPACAYFDIVHDRIGYACSASPDGNLFADWTRFGLDSASDDGGVPCLAVLGGRPAIAFANDLTGAQPSGLMFRQAASAGGESFTDWPASSRRVDPAFTDKFASVAEIDGRPAVAYYEGGLTQDLKYAINIGP